MYDCSTLRRRSPALVPQFALREYFFGDAEPERAVAVMVPQAPLRSGGSIATMPSPLRSAEPEAASPSHIASKGTLGLRAPVGIEVAAIVVAALYFGREVLIPVTLAMLLSFVLSPLVELLRRVWLGRILSVVLAVVLALGLILALGSAIGTQVVQLSGNLPQYQTTIETKITRLRNATVDKFSEKLGSFGHQPSGSAPRSEAPAPAPTSAPAQGQQQEPVPVVVTQPAPSVLDIGKSVLEPMLYPTATAGIILMVTIFALLQKEDLRDRAIRLLGSGDLHRTTVAMDEAGRRLSRYFLTQLGLNASFGVIVGLGLYFIGVPNPLLWGILGAVLRFVPYVGSWIAAALPIVLAAAVEPGWSMAIWTAVLYVVTELIIGQVGRAARLRPQHWPVAGRSNCCRDLLDLDLGADRVDYLDAVDAVPGRPRPTYRGARVFRRAAWRSSGADPEWKASISACSPAIPTRPKSRPSAISPISRSHPIMTRWCSRRCVSPPTTFCVVRSRRPRLDDFIASMDELIQDLGERTDFPRRPPRPEKLRSKRWPTGRRYRTRRRRERRRMRPAGAGMADRDAGPVHCRARSTRPIGGAHARPVARQTRAQGPHCAA